MFEKLLVCLYRPKVALNESKFIIRKRLDIRKYKIENVLNFYLNRWEVKKLTAFILGQFAW
ncbi:hypothetical protein M7I_4516 [Glarea lozoyensis 74030]|uniref:Uncharacterized protein n=1 Tax=Glarea lozoyensis (strain ATCC 74030 / MF5533) TaxID=1104152 RepID=H0EPE1_GLAL7|nr:hypothetical protein M7I_4516 [Glarea lozoyensis 74030]